MSFRIQIAQIFSNLGNGRRLQIVESIEIGISSLGEISREMGLLNSTVENYIQILVGADLGEVPRFNN